MSEFPNPDAKALIFEDEKLYICLASDSIAPGHTIVVWKDDVEDIHLLARSEYEHLMDIVDCTRNALLKVLNIEKVYLIYMDEYKHVHWHLVPRYEAVGFDALTQAPMKTINFSLRDPIKDAFIKDLS